MSSWKERFVIGSGYAFCAVVIFIIISSLFISWYEVSVAVQKFIQQYRL